MPLFPEPEEEERKPLTGGEMPQRYADAPPRPPKLPPVSKPKKKLPDGNNTDSNNTDGNNTDGDSKT